MTPLTRRSTCINTSRSYFRRVAMLLLATQLTLVGCDRAAVAKESVSGQPMSGGSQVMTSILTSGPIERTFHAVQWTPVWSRGGASEEQLLAVVAAVVPHDNGIVLADEGTLELTSFDGATGATLWTLGRKGGGPGEFQNIADITRDRDGNTLVLDKVLGRITSISPEGKLLPYRAPGVLQFAEAICALADGSIAAVMRRPEAWLMLVRDSLVERIYAFPVSLPNGSPDFVKAASFARGVSASTCPLFTLFGYGVGSIRSDTTALQLRPFSEALQQPEFEERVESTGPNPATRITLKSGTTSGRRGSVWRDTVMINFMGNPRPDKPLLDLYDTAGRYLTTWRYPAESIEYAVYANGTLYTMSNSTVSPQITAWRRNNPNTP